MLSYIRTLFVYFFISGLVSVAYGQDAGIQGKVMDPSGAAISKALVRVVDQQAGKERQTVANDNGQYNVPALSAGVYKIFVQAPGFSAGVSEPITLNPGQNEVMDFTLKLGTTSADVVVTAEKR